MVVSGQQGPLLIVNVTFHDFLTFWIAAMDCLEGVGTIFGKNCHVHLECCADLLFRECSVWLVVGLAIGDHDSIDGCFKDEHERCAEDEGAEKDEQVRDPGVGQVGRGDSEATRVDGEVRAACHHEANAHLDGEQHEGRPKGGGTDVSDA